MKCGPGSCPDWAGAFLTSFYQGKRRFISVFNRHLDQCPLHGSNDVNAHLKKYNTILKYMFKKMICTNCGEQGHAFRQCFAPVTSYGMIIFRIKNCWNQATTLLNAMTSVNGLDSVQANIEYLLIQRRECIGFVEIMRTKIQDS
jgi:hypothetical protein